MVPFAISDDEFNNFRSLIYKEAGINLSDLKRALVQSRLTKRIKILGVGTFGDYYRYLISNFDDEKIHFINAITTNKTDFFRENRHFEFMKETVLPKLESSGRGSIRIWSAGCSTGEEPYSIAMTLREYFEKTKKPDMKILASDIDTQVLESGREGIYEYEKIRDIDISLLKKYFIRGSGNNEGLFKVKDSIKQMIVFRRLNLQDQNYPMKKKFDIIFCRNVIIYFDKDTQKKIFMKFHDHLKDDGFLFIGHSENITTFTDRFHLIGNTIYRKNI